MNTDNGHVYEEGSFCFPGMQIAMTTHLTTLTSPEPVRSVLLLKSLILYLPNIINYISLPWCTDNKGKWRKTTHNLALAAWFWEKKQATSPVVQCVWHEICKYETTSLACEGIFTVLRGSQQTRHFLLQGLWFKSSQNDSDTKAARGADEVRKGLRSSARS